MFLRTDGAPSPVSAERQSRMRRPPSTLKVTWLIFFFGIFWNQNNKVMRQYHGLKQRRRTRRIHISLAPFGRKCQCSINFATWKNF